jgi:hypothetical protein
VGSEGLVNKVNYNLDKNRPRPSIRLCQEELRVTVKRDSNGSVEFNDSLKAYYVSKTEKGVRGAFMDKGTRNKLVRAKIFQWHIQSSGRTGNKTYLES